MLCLMERGCVGNTESPMGMHDMNGIIGMTAIAGAHIDGRERVKDCLSKISAASKHLLSLITDILDFSKIESGSITLSDEPFSISELLDNVVSMVSPQMRSRNQRFGAHHICFFKKWSTVFTTVLHVIILFLFFWSAAVLFLF